MPLSKQAKALSHVQIRTTLSHIATTRDATRNRVIFLLSVDAGLRAKEIASITWAMVTDASGELTDTIRLQDTASKGLSGGVVYMSKRLHGALEELKISTNDTEGHIVLSSRMRAPMSAQAVVNWFFTLYRDLGFDGCSSHSGRRTAITRWARKISTVGGSLRDVQALARHSSLQMTQRYIEVNPETREHSVDIEFSLPIVGDQLVYKNKKKKSLGYGIVEGSNRVTITQDFQERPGIKKRAFDGAV